MADQNSSQRGLVRDFISSVGLFFFLGVLAIFSVSCQESPQILVASSTPTASVTLTSTATLTPVPEDVVVIEPTEEQVISTPTLAPTATPSPLDLAIDDVSQRLGVDDLIIFGLNAEDLFNLLISVFIALLGALTGRLLIDGIRWLAKFTKPEFDDEILAVIHRQLKWLIALAFLEFATVRLDFLSPEVKQWLNLLYLSIFVIVIARFLWNLIDFALQGPLMRAASPQNRDLLTTFTPLMRRSIQVVIVLVSLAVILQNFGVNLSALLAILGLGGLAISLAAKETLEDMINGFIILIDRPYQIGDRIKIETMDTWGDVESIGSRTTRIRTMDNRLVIVPNSIIGREQVENYTYPDPSYRTDVSIGVAYGSDLDLVESEITRAVLSIPEVIRKRSPMVEFKEFGDSAIVIRVHYWLDAYANVLVRSNVNKAIYKALEDANVDMPFVTYDINLAYRESHQGGEVEDVQNQ